jgi:DnaJ-class molecular chaperone
MNPYKILELPDSKIVSKEEIKKAYKSLILKYHPDKNRNIDTTDKFKEIQTAYEILYNDESKKIYDNLPSQGQIKYYESLKKIIIKKYPEFTDYLKFIISHFYNDNENLLQKDLEEFNLNSIYEHLINKFTLKVSTNIPIKDLNIRGTLKADLKDLYNNKYESLIIKRETKEEINIYVPLFENNYILKGEGEINNEINGDILIKIEHNEIYENFTKMNNDLYVELEISLYDYLFGGKISFLNLDDSILEIEHESLLYKNIVKLENKGFKNGEEIGDMHIICTINDLEKNKEKIKNII